MSHFVQPGGGRLLANTGGADSQVRADSRPGDGRNFVVLDAVMPAGFVGPPRHLHVSMDEFFYVLDGAVEVEIGDERRWVQAGGSGFMPRGVRHRVWGPGDKPCRVLSVMSPGIFHAMEEMSAAGGENGASDPSKILALMTKYETLRSLRKAMPTNEEIARQLVAAMDHSPDALSQALAALRAETVVVRHHPAFPDDGPTRAAGLLHAEMAQHQAFYRAFPDYRYAKPDARATGAGVEYQMELRGTRRGEPITAPFRVGLTLADGKITAADIHIGEADVAKLRGILASLPPAPAAAPAPVARQRPPKAPTAKLKFGLVATTPPGMDGEALSAWLRRVDDGPWSTIATGESIDAGLEPLVMLSYAAAATKRVRLMTNIMILPMHPPVLLAKRMATLDVLSGGRVTIGTGVGHKVQDYLAAEKTMAQRHQRIDDMVKTMRSVWAGEAPFDEGGPVGPKPVQPGGPPIVASSQGPKSMARAARWADGYTSFTGAKGDLAEDVGRACDAWAAAGREKPPYLITSVFVALGAAERRGAWQALTTEDALNDMIDAVQAAGYDELLFVSGDPGPRHLDRLEAVIAAR